MDKIGSILNEFIFKSNYRVVINERQLVWRFDNDEGIELAYLTILPEEDNQLYDIAKSDTAIKLEYNGKVYIVAVAQRYYVEDEELEIHEF